MNPALWRPLRFFRWQRSNKRHGGDWPAPDLPVAAAPLLAIDLEMTGLDPEHDEIVSIGWVPISAGVIELEGAREHRLARGRRGTVGESATIHGLRDCDLDDARSATEGLGALVRALHGRIAVFHHAPLDLAFLARALDEHLGIRWGTPSIDTLAWYRRRRHLSGSDGSNRGAATLEAACRHHGLVSRSQHNALADALSCAELLLVMAHDSGARLLDVAQPPRGTSGK